MNAHNLPSAVDLYASADTMDILWCPTIKKSNLRKAEWSILEAEAKQAKDAIAPVLSMDHFEDACSALGASPTSIEQLRAALSSTYAVGHPGRDGNPSACLIANADKLVPSGGMDWKRTQGSERVALGLWEQRIGRQRSLDAWMPDLNVIHSYDLHWRQQHPFQEFCKALAEFCVSMWQDAAGVVFRGISQGDLLCIYSGGTKPLFKRKPGDFQFLPTRTVVFWHVHASSSSGENWIEHFKHLRASLMPGIPKAPYRKRPDTRPTHIRSLVVGDIWRNRLKGGLGATLSHNPSVGVLEVMIAGPGRFLFAPTFWTANTPAHRTLFNVPDSITTFEERDGRIPGLLGLGFADVHRKKRDVLYNRGGALAGASLTCSICPDAYRTAADPHHPTWPPDPAPTWLAGFLHE